VPVSINPPATKPVQGIPTPPMPPTPAP
jgi:hypothetical protein